MTSLDCFPIDYLRNKKRNIVYNANECKKIPIKIPIKISCQNVIEFHILIQMNISLLFFFLELNKEKLLDPFIHKTNIGIQMYIDCEYFVKEFSTYWFG